MPCINVKKNWACAMRKNICLMFIIVSIFSAPQRPIETAGTVERFAFCNMIQEISFPSNK